ncbi:MAG: hypothetical protein ACTSYC_12745 [Promethearchaeota archaeon]
MLSTRVRFLATALFDLIPESIHHLEELNLEGADLSEILAFWIIIFGFVVFLHSKKIFLLISWACSSKRKRICLL